MKSYDHRLGPYLAFFILLALNYEFASRGYVIAYTCISIYIILRLMKPFFKTVEQNSVLHLIIFTCIFFGSLHASLNLNIEYSPYQIMRSQIWSLLGLSFAIALSKQLANAHRNSIEGSFRFLSKLIGIIAITGLLDFSLGTHLSPSQIRVIDDSTSFSRLYLVGIELAAALFPVFAARKMYPSLAACAAIIIMTGGKMGIASLALAFLFTLISTQGSIKSKILISSLFLVLVITYGILLGSRIETFLIDGDIRRLQQIIDGLNFFATDPITIIFGGGLGTAYTEGYNAFSTSENQELDQSALLENSRFDIENGYVYLLARLGVLGTLAFLLLLGKGLSKGYRIYFLLYNILGWAGGSPVGPSYFMLSLSFVLGSVYFERLKKPVAG